ncbi:hypothetical protein FHR38_000717 [Micromonospora polyrhachis]|uniref:Uncharacterized protein n=1 Tax=Micromonospora polyrhachis TaxID=1282883 RepID=A0A7W7SLH7_9ACTN|nr:hypothetical protein [Micromonospora polyrhachis]
MEPQIVEVHLRIDLNQRNVEQRPDDEIDRLAEIGSHPAPRGRLRITLSTHVDNADVEFNRVGYRLPGFTIRDPETQATGLCLQNRPARRSPQQRQIDRATDFGKSADIEGRGRRVQELTEPDTGLGRRQGQPRVRHDVPPLIHGHPVFRMPERYHRILASRIIHVNPATAPHLTLFRETCHALSKLSSSDAPGGFSSA